MKINFRSLVPALIVPAFIGVIVLVTWLGSFAEAPKPVLQYDKTRSMVLVPGGIATIGDSNGEIDETNVYEQDLKAYWIGVKEVGVAEYAAFQKATGSSKATGAVTADLPVTTVNWYEALAYCNWLSAKEGFKPVYTIKQKQVTADWTADGYRLLNESEFEYAAKGGPFSNHKKYPGSAKALDVAHFDENSTGLSPRGSLQPNELGLYDMAGNVAEWVWDYYGMYPIQSQKDYHGPSEGQYRTTRGSAWNEDQYEMRVTDRYYQDPDLRSETIGFRLARTATGADAAQSLIKASAVPLVAPPADAPYKNAALPVADRVSDLLGRMSLDEKLGQMTQIAFGSLQGSAAIAEFGLGSILTGGDTQPGAGTADDWADLVQGYQKVALTTRLGIPILFGIDSVHGAAKVSGATIFPHNVGLGAANDPGLMEKMGMVVAEEMRASGLTWNFAPCVAVARDERWGRNYESFGEQPELATNLGSAFIRGLQGPVLKPGSIAATAKHFLADGGTQGGVDRGNAVIPEAELRRIHMAPYVAAIKAGTACIMASFSSWNDLQMHANKKLLTDVLRGELGFRGVLISDWAAQKELPGKPPEQIKAMINAGVDVCMVPDDIGRNGFIVMLKELVLSGDVPQARIDQAVSRMLALKFTLGLFEKPFGEKRQTGTVGSAAHRQIARALVAKSLVVLKNDQVLPLHAKTMVLTGSLAKDLEAQCGGWTMGWQSAEGTISGVTGILPALTESAKAKGLTLVYSENGFPPSGKPDLVIVVAGERPYAEFEGDRKDLRLPIADRELIVSLKKRGIPVILLLLSGRPMVITELLPSLDGLVAAWLPGSEGKGVADVLFGDVKSTGRLPMSWPESNEQIPVNAGDGKKPLFAFGFGLDL